MKRIGREREIAILEEALSSSKAEMIALYGRRRIGKTFLIDTFYAGKNALVVKMVGQSGATMRTQIENVAAMLREQHGIELPKNAKWRDVFASLAVMHQNMTHPRNFVVFIDELPWISTAKSGFIGALGYSWNTYFSRYENATFVLCGSAAAWMIRNIAGDKGELHQRITRKIRLMPFDLRETREYLRMRGFRLADRNIIDYYMVLGGVAQYLSYLDPKKSFAQNIDAICFSDTGGLYREFPLLFTALFGKSGIHEVIVKALGSKTKRIGAPELSKKIKKSSDQLYRALDDLEHAGFIKSYPFYHNAKRNTTYALIDPYCHFYLHWISALPSTVMMENSHYWQMQVQTQAWKSWSGFAFEMLCHQHILQIKKALGISGVMTTSYAWFVQGTSDTKGAQIDLLLARKDQMINVIECKYYDGVFTFSKQYEQNILNKIERFRETEKVEQPVTAVLLTTKGSKRASGVGLDYVDLKVDVLFESI